MEFKIYNPKENDFVKTIEWNNEELKAEIAEKIKDYEGLVYVGDDQIKEAKADRANLNKLKNAIEDERKRIKSLCLESYNRFEVQVKEVTAMIDKPIALIDKQIKEAEENKKAEKRASIETVFNSEGFPDFVSLEMIWDPKWLNASVSLSKIDEAMRERLDLIDKDVATINALPGFSFEAMAVYKETLDLAAAVKEGKRLMDIQKAKEAQKATEAAVRAREDAQNAKGIESSIETLNAHDEAQTATQACPESAAPATERTLRITFIVTAKESQFKAVNAALAAIREAGATLEIISKKEA